MCLNINLNYVADEKLFSSQKPCNSQESACQEYFQSCNSTVGPILAFNSEELCYIYPIPANVFNLHPQNSWQGNAGGVLLSYCCLMLFFLTSWSEVCILLSGHYSLEYPGSAVLSIFPLKVHHCLCFSLSSFYKVITSKDKVLGPFSICHKIKSEILPLAYLPVIWDGGSLWLPWGWWRW